MTSGIANLLWWLGDPLSECDGNLSEEQAFRLQTLAATQEYTRKACGMAEKVVIKAKGQDPMSFKKGALHRQLHVPEGEAIPEAKKREALSGKRGPLAKKRAAFGFKGALAAGRRTAAGR